MDIHMNPILVNGQPYYPQLGCASQTVLVKYEKIHPDAIIPTKGTELRAYYDVYSVEDIELTPEKVYMVHTGLKIQPIVGWFVDIRPRSGLAKEGITINNSPGTLDSDYGGELMIELIWHENPHGISIAEEDIPGFREKGHASANHYIKTHKINKGDRIAQISVMPMHYISFIEDKIEGTGGFGSTGK